jgi:hypothetical protein
MTTTSIPQISPVAQIRALHDRLIKAEALVASGKVRPVYAMQGHYFVEGTKDVYLVNGECQCPDAVNRAELIKGMCKHRLAAIIYKEQEQTASDPKVIKAIETASVLPESDRTLEDQLEDLYPKAKPTDSER